MCFTLVEMYRAYFLTPDLSVCVAGPPVSTISSCPGSI